MNLFRKFKTALIDMDGVLYDSMPGHTLAWKRMMTEIGVECSRDEFYLYEGMTGVATVNLLFKRAFGHGCSDEEARRLYQIKSGYFKELGPARRMAGADRMLTALREGGLKRVLVTGSAQRSLLDKLDADYPGSFGQQMRVTAGDVSHGKPHPEPYLKGASLACTVPSDALVIENAPLGVRAGKAAECFTIAVTTGPIPREEFEKEGADMIFGSMEEFAGFLESELAMLSPIEKKFRRAVGALDADKVFILTDENVRPHIEKIIPFSDSCHVIKPGERSKDLSVLAEIWKWLGNSGATRKSLLVNIGGGVVSDLGGFAAATYKRGIRFVNMPTTLLAAADAAIGGKTGIDFMGLKNQVGAFAMPEAVITIPELFGSLPRKEILSGFAEVVKTALLDNEGLYKKIIDGNPLEDKALMADIVSRAAKFKQEIVALDPNEKGLRRILNLGHTAAHAFESLSASLGHPVSHGKAVAHGLLVALYLSCKIAGFPEEEVKDYRQRILDRYYDSLPFGPEKTDELIELMIHDKKNCGNGDVSFVLLRAIGNPVQAVSVSREDIAAAIKVCCHKNKG